MRNTADAKRFVDVSETEGVRAAVAERDGAFGDYSQAPDDEKPNPKNVIRP
jgi:enoyl-CoA hydratase